MIHIAPQDAYQPDQNRGCVNVIVFNKKEIK
jgi:hypothetical protein